MHTSASRNHNSTQGRVTAMSQRRTIIGLCMLSALAFSATAAQSASAATKSLTVFTCKVPTGKEFDEKRVDGVAFKDEHCKEESGSGTFRHVTVPAETTTEI